MRETLEALVAGELSVGEAEARLAGYVTTPSGRFDAARERRRGIPEGILADGKTSAEVVELAETAIDAVGRALVTRADPATAEAIEAAFEDAEASVERDDRSRVVVVRSADFEAPTLDATACIVTGGTSDAAVAGEAAAVLEAVGVDVTTVADVGVANLERVLDQLDVVRGADVVIVAAGREGALPTVVAGLVDAPVIGVPVSTGYGAGGDGEAALYGLLQSCTVLSVVNIDAGFTAGAQAALIARRIADRRDEDDGGT